MKDLDNLSYVVLTAPTADELTDMFADLRDEWEAQGGVAVSTSVSTATVGGAVSVHERRVYSVLMKRTFSLAFEVTSTEESVKEIDYAGVY